MKQVLSTFLLLLFTFLLTAQPTAKQLDAYFTEAHQDWDIPGMAIGIIKDGEVILAKGYGVLEVGKEEPVDANTLFAIASNTKAFISASLALLVDRGAISWDDTVVDHLPYFRMYDDFVTQHTTIRDLLCHRAGLGTFSGDVIWYKSNYPGEELVKRVAELPAAYDFRAGYGYSNLMFITAGEVIKAVTGQPWDAFVKEHFFGPLKMDRTITSTDELEKMSNVATPHKHKRMYGKNEPIEWVNWDNMGAAGGIISSVNDMLNWVQLQIDQGRWEGEPLISADRQIDYWTPHNSYRLSSNARRNYPMRHFSGYGLGWGVFDYDGRFVASHSGGYDGMFSRVAIMPEERLGIVVLTNSMKSISNAIMYYTFDRFLGRDLRDWSGEGLENYLRGKEEHEEWLDNLRTQRLAGTQPGLPLSDYTGFYRCERYGEIEVEIEDGQLKLDFKPAPDLAATLEHWHFNTFEIKWEKEHAWFDFGTVQFVLDNNGGVEGIEFDVPNYDIFFHEIKARKVK